MMDMEQRMAEIASRSERILRKRRRRKRVAMACIPLVVCMAVLAGRYLQMNDAVQQEGYAEAVVEVVRGCMDYEIKDPERVAQIGELLYSCMDDRLQNGDKLPEDYIYGGVLGKPETDNGEDMDSSEDITGTFPVTGALPTMGDMITVTLSNGTTHCYRLVGNQLTDRDTQKTVSLSDEKAAQLRELLADRGE